MTDIPEALRGWVAEDDEVSRPVIEPVYIDYRAERDIRPYHPNILGDTKYLIKHVAAIDDNGTPYVKVGEFSQHWSPQFQLLFAELKLYPQRDNFGIAILKATDLPAIDTGGWLAHEWLVVHSRNSDGEEVHQDIILWKRSGLTVPSLYAWRPYNTRPNGVLV